MNCCYWNLFYMMESNAKRSRNVSNRHHWCALFHLNSKLNAHRLIWHSRIHTPADIANFAKDYENAPKGKWLKEISTNTGFDCHFNQVVKSISNILRAFAMLLSHISLKKTENYTFKVPTNKIWLKKISFLHRLLHEILDCWMQNGEQSTKHKE